MDRGNLIAAIQSAFAQAGEQYLTFPRFREITGINKYKLLRYFDGWMDACLEAGVPSGDNGPANIVPNSSKGKGHAIQQLRAVASTLGIRILSQSQFNAARPEITARTVVRLCGSWSKALDEANLERHPNYYEEVPFEELTEEFLQAYRNLGKLPTLLQMGKRSKYSQPLFERKCGSYAAFKRQAIEELLTSNIYLTNHERLFFKQIGNEFAIIREAKLQPHARGRHLGFRAFAFAPTYENEVVSMFSVIAEELGFEIVAQRPAFPDCEARRLYDKRRSRYSTCLIEFEFKSRDFVTHKHPHSGCDLIVCWEHNWKDCPIEVLELRTEIRKLDGWK